jgi:hypothetical protein
MAKITLSFEIDGVNEEDTDEIEENIKELLKFGGEQLDCDIYDINFIKFETSCKEYNEEDEE